MKIVVDTNCFLQILSKKFIYHQILLEILSGELDLLISHDVFLEYEEVFKIQTSEKFTNLFLGALIDYKSVTKIDVYFQWDLIDVDKDDNKFVDLGLNGNADFLITNDGHFNVIKAIKFPTLHIISLAEFYEKFYEQ